MTEEEISKMETFDTKISELESEKEALQQEISQYQEQISTLEQETQSQLQIIEAFKVSKTILQNFDD